MNRHRDIAQMMRAAAPSGGTGGLVLEITTTGSAETFTLPCFDSGTYDAIISWGDGKPDSVITTWNDIGLAHEYDDAGVYEAEITGDLPHIYFNNGGDINKVTGIPRSGPLCNVSSMLNSFWGCMVATLPQEFYTPTVISYRRAFLKTDIESIPAQLFDNSALLSDISNCFNACNSLLSIPAALFDNVPNDLNLAGTFQLCAQLPSISAGLFDSFAAVTSFKACFSGCTSLTEVPAGLFDNCVAATDYTNCFKLCDLNQQSTDNVLVSVDTAGASNGTLDIGGSQPSATGEAAKANLEGKGWTVTITTP